MRLEVGFVAGTEVPLSDFVSPMEVPVARNMIHHVHRTSFHFYLAVGDGGVDIYRIDDHNDLKFVKNLNTGTILHLEHTHINKTLHIVDLHIKH